MTGVFHICSINFIYLHLYVGNDSINQSLILIYQVHHQSADIQLQQITW